MNSFGLDVCEICGSQSADHAGWFAIAGHGASMEVLPWTDDVRGRSDCRTVCCGDHAEKLVLTAATHDLSGATFLTAPRRWHPEALVPIAARAIADLDADDSLSSILSAVDAILHSDDEDEPAPRFDA